MTEAWGLIPILNVSNLEQSFDWFAKLGFEKRWDWGDPPGFGAVGWGGHEIFLCLDCQGGRGEEGMWLALVVDDVDALYQRCRSAGIEIMQEPVEQEWGMREALVRHPDGHVLRLGRPTDPAAFDHTVGEPVVVERVDLTLRIEKRLAALLEDLARLKGLSLTGAVEETLLHTIDGVGPHTMGQLEQIRELKARHGVTWDTHASYRFVERE